MEIGASLDLECDGDVIAATMVKTKQLQTRAMTGIGKIFRQTARNASGIVMFTCRTVQPSRLDIGVGREIGKKFSEPAAASRPITRWCGERSKTTDVACLRHFATEDDLLALLLEFQDPFGIEHHGPNRNTSASPRTVVVWPPVPINPTFSIVSRSSPSIRSIAAAQMLDFTP